MYPRDCPQPIKESALLTGPLEPTNESYAMAKICAAVMCQAYNKQYKTNFICAVPATVYGPGDHFDNTGHVLSGLIRKFYEAKKNKSRTVQAWGTGRPKREFIYIDDLADACLLLMKRYSGSHLVNIGTQQESTIAELAYMVKAISGCKADIVFRKNMPDGARRKLLDSKKIRSLGFRPKVSLRKGIEAAYTWYENHTSNTHA